MSITQILATILAIFSGLFSGNVPADVNNAAAADTESNVVVVADNDEEEVKGIRPGNSSTEELSWDIINITNAYRASRGIAPMEGSIGGNAKGHSDWMASNQILEHTTDPNVGENVAQIYTSNLTADYVVGKWQASPGHNENLLNPNYRTIQVWCTDAANDYSYCTQQFTY